MGLRDWNRAAARAEEIEHYCLYTDVLQPSLIVAQHMTERNVGPNAIGVIPRDDIVMDAWYCFDLSKERNV